MARFSTWDPKNPNIQSGLTTPEEAASISASIREAAADSLVVPDLQLAYFIADDTVSVFGGVMTYDLEIDDGTAILNFDVHDTWGTRQHLEPIRGGADILILFRFGTHILEAYRLENQRIRKKYVHNAEGACIAFAITGEITQLGLQDAIPLMYPEKNEA